MSQLYVKSVVLNHLYNHQTSQLLFCVNGEAGTGKSHLLKDLRSEIVKKYGHKAVLTVAPTGVAAINVDGLTIHTAFKIPIDGFDAMQRIRSAATLTPSYVDVKYLIIDEMSMISSKLFTEIDKRMQIILQCKDRFGGASVLLFGDLFQLKPVNGDWIFISSAWNYFRQVTLKTNYRMILNKEYALLCQLLRQGKLKVEQIRLLKRRCRENVSQFEAAKFEDSIHLFSRKADVESFNANFLKNLSARKHVFHCTDIHVSRSRNVVITPQQMSHKREVGGLPTKLTLAVGAKVMLCKNLNIKAGLVNGRTGTVIKLFPVIVRFDSISQYPGVELEINIVEVSEEADFSTIFRRQYPLLNGPGYTIHKVQGLTLDKIVIDFSNIFCSSLAFVALSRVRNITDILVDNLNAKKMLFYLPDTAALKQVQQVEQKSEAFPNYISFNIGFSSLSKKSLFKL